jgi:ribosome-binding protein aMBF1 (putative translation factor)
MSFFFVEPEVYKKYKDQVLELSQSIQVNYVEHLSPEKRRPGFSDKQIAEKLGLDERVVREIRCVGEREFYDVEEWEKAASFKEQQCRAFAERGVSSATRKYFDRQKEADE